MSRATPTSWASMAADKRYGAYQPVSGTLSKLAHGQTCLTSTFSPIQRMLLYKHNHIIIYNQTTQP